MLRWLISLLFRRFRWVALAAAVRALTRRQRERAIDTATTDLSDRLPDGVVKAIDSAPGDLLRLGGAAMASGRAARRLRRLPGSSVLRPTQQISDVRTRFRGQVQNATDEWRFESERARRGYWAAYHRSRGDLTAADNALLDRRADPEVVDATPLPEIPAPVPTGRKRSRRPSPTLINRVQRTYHQAKRPWDS